MMDSLKKISKLLNYKLVGSDGFTIPELLGMIAGDNEREIEDRIFAIINYKKDQWQDLVKAMFGDESIRCAENKLQFGFVVRELIKTAELGHGKQ